MTAAGQAAMAAISRIMFYDESFPNQDLRTVRTWTEACRDHQIPAAEAIAAVDAWYSTYPGKRIILTDVVHRVLMMRRNRLKQHRDDSRPSTSRARATDPLLTEIRVHGMTVVCSYCHALIGQPCVTKVDGIPLTMIVHPMRTKLADIVAKRGVI